MTYTNPPAHPDQHFGNISYAQHGDDFMILNLLKLMELPHARYLDLGAHHPFNISNTALLYQRGHRGVNVEANRVLVERFQVHRKEDINVNVGVGPVAGSFTFYKYDAESGRNTFSPEEVESLKRVMTVREVETVPVVTLPQLVTLCCGGRYPEFLSCDIEGFDYDVLCQLPDAWVITNSPSLICVETRLAHQGAMRDMLYKKGYQFICRMGENLFFTRHDYSDRIF